MQRRFTYPFLAILVFLLLLSCNCGNENELLNRAEAFLPAEPDSADSVLRLVSSSQDLSKADRALFGLLRTYTDNRMGNRITSDSLIASSHAYYYRQSSGGETSDSTLLRRYGQCCYYMGLYYSSCDSTRLCEEQFRNAIKASERCADWHTCYLACTQLGLSAQMSNPKYSTDLMQKALSVYNRIKDDPNNEALILSKLAGSYLVQSKFYKSLHYYQKALRIAEEHKLMVTANQVCMSIADVYRFLGERGNALEYAKRGISTAEGGVLVTSVLTLAKCYLENDSLIQAHKLLNNLAVEQGDFLNRYFKNRYLSETLLRLNKRESAQMYADSAFLCLESQYDKSLKEKDDYYQYSMAKEKESEKNREASRRNKWISVLLVQLIILLAAFSYFMHRIQRGRERQRRLIAIQSQRLQNTTLLYGKLKVERELYSKERDLAHIKELYRQKAYSISVMQKYLMRDLERVSGNINDTCDEKISEQTWKEAEDLLNYTDNDFMRRLRKAFPNLGEEDYRLCLLVRLRFSNATIGSIFSITKSAIQKRKSTLKKQGFRENRPNMTLEQFLELFSQNVLKTDSLA